MDFIDGILQLLYDSVLLMLQLTLELFGGILIIGFLLYLSARFTRNLYAQTFGHRTEVFITAWIGTPVHELGHVFFCLVFGHRIKKITLFNPNSNDGSMGSVVHTYNSRNLYQRTGNFFIGAGPLLFGSLFICLLICLLLPSGGAVINHISSGQIILSTDPDGFIIFLKAIWQQTLTLIPIIFSVTNFGHWQFWLFMYLSLAVSTHMELSLPDLKQMWGGLLFIMILIFLFNVIYLLFFSSYNNILFKGIMLTAYLNQILILGLFFSLINFLLSWIVTIIYGVIVLRKFPNPVIRS